MKTKKAVPQQGTIEPLPLGQKGLKALMRSGAADRALIKTMGDGCLASFGSAADAVTAAIALLHAAGACVSRRCRASVSGSGSRSAA